MCNRVKVFQETAVLDHLFKIVYFLSYSTVKLPSIPAQLMIFCRSWRLTKLSKSDRGQLSILYKISES
jgi:hypothetical protein